MNRRSFLKKSAVVVSVGASSMLVLKPYPAMKTEIFGDLGQSNMSSRGLLSQLPSFSNVHLTRVFTNAWTWVEGYEPMDDPTGQVDTVSEDLNAGASSGLSFATTLARLRPNRIIGMVPCAKGGSSMAQWARDLSRSTLYGSMIARLQAARAYGTVKGIRYYQGEAETPAAFTSAANVWDTSFLTLAQNICDDLDDQDLKFIVTELGPCPDETLYPNWSLVQSKQRSLHGARDGNVSCVSAADLSGKVGDEIHIDTASQVTLGQRHAIEMDRLLS